MSPRQSVLELARRAAHLGWAVGDGGDIAVRNGARVLVTPARPDKSHIYEEDLLLLEDGSLSGNTSPGASVAVPTALPVMLSILSDPQVGAVVHGHGVFSLLAAAAFPNGLRVRHLEMMARLTDGSDDEMHVVPVIANSRDARELARSLSVAKARNPDTCAVLVRNHGAFVWGRDAVAAKANMEIYDAMFQYVVEMRKLGIDDAIVDADEPEISTRRTVLPAVRTKTGSV